MSKQTDLINIPDAITVSGSNVGIGTSSPDANLSLKSPIYTSGGTGNGIRFQNQNNNADAVIQSYYSGTSTSALLHGSNSYLSTSASFTAFDSSKASSYVLQNTNGAIEFGNNTSGNPTERMQIDSSGDVRIGSGTASTYVQLTVNGASTSNYGPMIELQSAGTAFGKISNYGRVQGGTSTDMFVTTATTNNLILGTNNAERMRITSDKVQFNVDAKVNADNSHDLGAGGARWKDLYLSGGIHLGGTGSANKLDDYEEGTWTPAFIFTNGGTVTHGSRAGVYTKIGKIVLASFNIRTTGVSGVTGELQLSGLPFTVQSTGTGGRTGGSQGFARNWGADMPNFRIYSFPGQAKLLFYYNAMNGGTQQVGASQFSTGSDSNVAEWSIAYFTEE